MNGRKMLEMYRSVFKLPSIRTGDLRVLYPMTAHTITPSAGPHVDKECKQATCGFPII